MYLNHNQQTMPNGLVRLQSLVTPFTTGLSGPLGWEIQSGISVQPGGQKTRQGCRPRGLGLDTPGL